jgi:hypothetical protein
MRGRSSLLEGNGTKAKDSIGLRDSHLSKAGCPISIQPQTSSQETNGERKRVDLHAGLTPRRILDKGANECRAGQGLLGIDAGAFCTQ